MSDNPGDGVREGPRESGPLPIGTLPTVRPRRHSLWLLLVPAVLYCLAPVVADRIEPRVLGVPFLLAWIIAATVVSPLVIWAAARLDPAYRLGALEPIPVDDPSGSGNGGADEGGSEGGIR